MHPKRLLSLALLLANACGGTGTESPPDAASAIADATPRADAGSQTTLFLPAAILFESHAVGDFLGDGSVVVLIGGTDWAQRNVPTKLFAVRVAADGSLSDVTARLLPEQPTVVHYKKGLVHDWNHDGRPDFASANTGWDKSPWPGDWQTVFISQPDGTLRPATLPPILGYAHSGAIGDLRKNGRMDIYVGEYNGTPNPDLPDAYKGPNVWPGEDRVGPYILRDNGDGTFTYDNVSLPPALAVSWMAPPGVPGRHTASLIVDVNRDGYGDLVVGADENGDTAGALYMNDGHGSFANAKPKPLPVGHFGARNTTVVDALAVDVNRDGWMDVLLDEVPLSPVFYGGRWIQILINDQVGGFVDETATRMPSQPGGPYWAPVIAAGDYDSDGDVDLYMQASFTYPAQPGVGPDDAILYLDDGQGRFAPAPDALLPPRSAWHQMVPCDFNRDGRVDFIDVVPDRYDEPIMQTRMVVKSYAGGAR